MRRHVISGELHGSSLSRIEGTRKNAGFGENLCGVGKNQPGRLSGRGYCWTAGDT